MLKRIIGSSSASWVKRNSDGKLGAREILVVVVVVKSCNATAALWCARIIVMASEAYSRIEWSSSSSGGSVLQKQQATIAFSFSFSFSSCSSNGKQSIERVVYCLSARCTAIELPLHYSIRVSVSVGEHRALPTSTYCTYVSRLSR